MKRIGRMKAVLKTLNGLMVVGWICAAIAFAEGFDITSGSDSYNGVFNRLVDFVQDCVNFVQGPFAVVFIVLGIVVSLCLWIMAPDNRHLNKAFKAIAVGFILFDLGVIMNFMISN